MAPRGQRTRPLNATMKLSKYTPSGMTQRRGTAATFWLR